MNVLHVPSAKPTLCSSPRYQFGNECNIWTGDKPMYILVTEQWKIWWVCRMAADKTRSPTSLINSERTANSPPRNVLADLPTTFACFVEVLDTRQANVQKIPLLLPKQRPEQLMLRKDHLPLQMIWKNRVQLQWLHMDQELCWTPPCTHRVKTQCVRSFLQFLNNSFSF